MKFARYEEPIAVCIPPSVPAEELPRLAQRVESVGFRDVWVAEDYFELAAFASAGIMLGSTSRLRCGIGIVSSVTRHPAVTAMELGTLGRAFPQRLVAGIGHGVPAWTQQMGLYPKSPLSVLREVVIAVRRLLAGETLTARDGHFTFDEIKLSQPCPEIEIVTGVLGPRSLEVSGEIADGTLASVLSSTPYLAQAMTHIERGAKRAGRTEHALPTLAIFACDTDRAVARAAAGAVIAHYLTAVGPTPLTETLGINEEIATLQKLGDPVAAAREMPESWIDLLAVAGTPDDCAARIRELLDAGAAQVSLVVAAADRMGEQLEIAAREVLPAVVRS